MRGLGTERAGRAAAVVDWLVLAVAVALPCRQLAALGSDFYIDWANHQWAIGYTGEYFHRHWTMPAVFNTAELGGLAVPVFYGNLFYPVMGLVARVSSPELAIRIAVVALYAVQFRLVARAAVAVGVPRTLALAVACLVTWAIYPLTNLYNRGALTEFFATGLLGCALALLVLVCRAEAAGQRRRRACALGLALTLAAGTHPITAMLGLPMFAALGGAFCWLLRGDRARVRAIAGAIAPWLGLAAVCVAPWLYATARYSAHLAIRHVHPEVVFFPDSLDAWSSRFALLPGDPRVAPGVAPGAVSTPYLDAQLNLALLFAFAVIAVIAVLAVRTAARTAGGSPRAPLAMVLTLVIALFWLFTAMSLVPATYRALPELAAMIQFAYRAVTYQNLALLAGVFLVALAVPALASRLRHPAVYAVVAGCVALSAAGVVVKWRHVAVIQRVRAPVDVGHLPAAYYGAIDYATEDQFAPLGGEPSVARPFGFGTGRRFGLANPLAVDVPAPTWIATNVQSFVWNAIRIDGARVAAADLRTANGMLVVRVPAGAHQLTWRFQPPAVWQILRVAALLGLLGWMIAVVVELVLALRRRGELV